MAAMGELPEWIDRFLCGDDISIAAANAIEAAIDNLFPEDQQMQALVEVLASYRPGGGDYLYSEDEVRAALRKVIHRVQLGE